MKYSVAAILALAAAAFAAPTAGNYEQPCDECEGDRTHYPEPHHEEHHGHHGHGHCENPTFVDSGLLVLDIDVNVDVSLLGILDLDVDLDVKLGRVREHHPQCKAIYCCPSRCERGRHVPKECREYGRDE